MIINYIKKKKENLNFIKKLNLVKIINDFVKLEKCGNNYRGYSPFKKENNPSFMVSPKKKIWKDFSTGKGGNIVTFIMYYFNYNYIESLKFLMKKYSNNKLVLSNNYSNNNIFLKINNILKVVNKYYKKNLNNNKKILNYLINRGLDYKIIKKFSLGYSNNVTILDIIKKKKIFYNNFILKNTGLFCLIKKNLFYLFKNRIIFPIKNLYGNIIGFGGRTLNLFNRNKYINSPNNLIYNKSKILYGLYQAKKYILKKNFCYIVEGYMDLLSLYKNKIKNVISTLGTNINNIHIDLIKKFTNNVILLYDGDKTGINAAINNINIFLNNDINIRFIILPKNKDPNTFILSKLNLIKNFNIYFKKKSLNFIDLKKNIFSNLLKDPYKKYTFIKNILENIKHINNSLIKEFYIQKLVKDFKINKEYIYKEINIDYNNNKKNIINKKEKKSINKNKQLLINCKKLINLYKKLLFDLIKKYEKIVNYYFKFKNKIININKILKNFFKLLNKYKIIIYNKKYINLLNIIKKKINNKKIIYQTINYINNKNLSNKSILNNIKEIILKYKLNLILKNIYIYNKKIKKSKDNNNLLYKIFYLTKFKNKIINKLYYL
ncbi:MAG: DNA primase [Candidatus Shikimatogenerans sp. JK-2022]|nr:DNA primase [Candidatus Shikimatogenerans bostrichidophilus]